MGGFTELFNTNSRNGFDNVIRGVANDAIREVTGLNSVLGRGGQVNMRKIGRQMQTEAKRQARRDRQEERNRERAEKARSRNAQREEPEEPESENQESTGSDNELPQDTRDVWTAPGATPESEQQQTQVQEVGNGGIKEVTLADIPDDPRASSAQTQLNEIEVPDAGVMGVYDPNDSEPVLDNPLLKVADNELIDMQIAPELDGLNDEWQVYKGHSDGAYDQNTAELQTLLKKLDELDPDIGIDLGEFGPNKDGVDGVFGDMTQSSVIKTQMALYQDLGIDDVPDGVGDQQLKELIEQKIDQLENPPEQAPQEPAATFSAKPVTIEV